VSARAFVLSMALAGAAALPAAAQDSGIVLDLAGGWQDLTSAKESAKAVFDGSSGGATFGGGLRYEFQSGLYVGAFMRYFSKDGERVFVASPDGEVFPLGHPLSLKIIPIHGSVGWRFGKSALRPYVAAGAGLASVKEESTVAGVVESSSESKFSYHVLGGFEYASGAFRIGTEVMWTGIPDSIGVAGVSEVYGESDLGGVSAVLRVGFAFGR
jgi:opacity protein-like surface antigen